MAGDAAARLDIGRLVAGIENVSVQESPGVGLTGLLEPRVMIKTAARAMIPPIATTKGLWFMSLYRHRDTCALYIEKEKPFASFAGFADVKRVARIHALSLCSVRHPCLTWSAASYRTETRVDGMGFVRRAGKPGSTAGRMPAATERCGDAPQRVALPGFQFSGQRLFANLQPAMHWPVFHSVRALR